MWPLEQIADVMAEVLRARDAALREEHAVYGLDAMVETELHPVVAEGMAGAGWGVLREQPYPHEWFRKLREKKDGLDRPIPRDRMRCDVVLTPQAGQTLDDSLVNEKQRRADAAEIEGTLFESLMGSHLAPGAVGNMTEHSGEDHEQDARGTVPPEEVFWLELKVVGQFCNTAGVPGPNRTYASEITRNPIADLRKLSDDHRIAHGGVGLIVFTADEATAKHDLAVLAHRCLDKGMPIALGGPAIRSFAIPDRMGNAACSVCVLGVRKD